MATPHAIPITLSETDRGRLQGWVRRRKTGQALATRARIVLACAEPGTSNGGVAETLGVSRTTVALWRRRFAARGVDGLLDEPRPGAPRKITDEQVERAVVTTLEASPTNATHWSTRSLARATGLSQTAICRIWHAFALKPHRADTFKLSTDPLFVEKIRDVVGLYLSPPERALALCVDEKPQIQAVERTAPVLPMRPGQPERRTHDYKRHGTLDLFAALDAKTGAAIGQCRPRHRAQEFRAFLDEIDRSVPPDLEVHLVLDSLRTHKTGLIRDWLAKRPRHHLHFTPTSASWLNLVEGWFALLTLRQIRRGVFPTIEALERTIRQYIKATNADPHPFVWTKNADDILESTRRFCQRTVDVNKCQQTSNSGHEPMLVRRITIAGVMTVAR
ncbi:MAG: IS630 family transposase [Acetobacteraceae bacterium]|nr:IS630 family transposase [Acetobacteraceae bacterium]